IAIVQEYKDKAQTKLKDNLTIFFNYKQEQTRAMKRIFGVLKREVPLVSDIEKKKEGLITSVCERCEREFAFYQLIPNDQGELLCQEECFRTHQSEEKKKSTEMIPQEETAQRETLYQKLDDYQAEIQVDPKNN